MPKRNYTRDERGRFATSGHGASLRGKAKMHKSRGDALFRAQHEGQRIGAQSADKSWANANTLWTLAEGHKTTGKRGRKSTAGKTVRYGTGVGVYLTNRL